MARDIQDLTNVDSPDSDYPYGRVRDITAPGASDGTPVDEMLLGDIIQFFNKLMDEGGITANGLPDNDYVGFQLFQALEGLVPEIKYRGVTAYTDGNDLPLTNISSTYYVMNFTTINNEIAIASNVFSDEVVSFGDDMPLGTTIRISATNGVNPVNYTLNSTNAGGLPVLRLKGVTANNTNFLVEENETVQFTRMNDGWMGISDTDT